MMLIINNKISWSFFYTCAMFWYLKPALLYNKLKALSSSCLNVNPGHFSVKAELQLLTRSDLKIILHEFKHSIPLREWRHKATTLLLLYEFVSSAKDDCFG